MERMNTIRTTIEIDVEVEYTFDAGEPEIRYYPGKRGCCPNGDGHPGCPASVEIQSVRIGNVDIADFLTPVQIEGLAETCMDDAMKGEEP